MLGVLISMGIRLVGMLCLLLSVFDYRKTLSFANTVSPTVTGERTEAASRTEKRARRSREIFREGVIGASIGR